MTAPSPPVVRLGLSPGHPSTRTAPSSTSGSRARRSAPSPRARSALRPGVAAGADRAGSPRDAAGRGARPAGTPATTEDVWLRLHLLSAAPPGPTRSTWTASSGCSPTSCGPAPARAPSRGFETTRMRLRANRAPPDRLRGRQFPRMVDYVLPAGVRVADADRVRLGATSPRGMTVMHEGFVNYNAGTWASMVEGRISAGVVVGDGSDVGGGASIMGTLSGRRGRLRRQRCLLGANAGPASRWATTASSRRATSPPAPRSPSPTWTASPRWSRPRAVGGEQRALPPQLGHRRRRGGAVEERRRRAERPARQLRHAR